MDSNRQVEWWHRISSKGAKKYAENSLLLSPKLPNLSLCVAVFRVRPSLMLPHFPVASASLPNLFATSSAIVHYAICAVNFNVPSN
uniref:Uncharacterized protein n=1 Tax=Parascaris univalens TaxID=6257 RepID=A0A915BHB0_PARUN